MTESKLVITASPHLKDRDTTPKIMWNVVGSLVPVVLASAYFFGVSALLIIAAATAGCVATEAALGRKGALLDGSAMITGIMLGLCLPPGIALWMAFVGGAFGIGFGKVIWGGLGQNVFNPALIGRAFLQTAFPVAITTWPTPGGKFWALKGDLFAAPFMHPLPHAVTSATPLGLFKFEKQLTPITDLVMGTTGGSVGETAAVIIILCGVYLGVRGYLNWRAPVAIVLTVMVFSQLLHLLDPAKAPGALFMVFSGGLLFGAVFMATDMVTTPTTNLGRIYFGIGVGMLVVIIRIYGGLPEGVMYAILIMNGFAPMLNRITQPAVFGTRMRIAK